MSAHTTLYVNNINEKVNPNKLRYVLQKLFGRYGHVVDISVSPALRMKGQAFITYESSQSCLKALSKLQNRPMFKKPIHIARANQGSDEYRRQVGDTAGIEKRKQIKAEKMVQAKENKANESKLPFTKAQVRSWTALPPNSTLLYQNVAESQFGEGILESQFGSFSGFVKIRPVPFRKVAFIDFVDESSATACLQGSKPSLNPTTLLTYAKK